ncbi:hypothetical protein J7J81_00310 [bacterium]|nr:hypothetical protein [bacterium]
MKKEVQNKRVAHAYLFVGPSGLGKKKIALEFVKLLNCQVPNFADRPCQHCSSCLSITQGTNPDTHIISPSNSKDDPLSREEIGIDEIRELQSFLRLKVYKASFKSVIIDEAEKMNVFAQNSLLKLIEEPKERTVFIIISSRKEMMLSTLYSRMQIIKFLPLPLPQARKFLQDKVSAKDLDNLVFLSQGRLGLAMRLINNPQKFRLFLKTFSKISQVLTSPYFDRFQFVKAFLQEKSDLLTPSELLDIFSVYFKEALFYKLGLKKDANSNSFGRVNFNPYFKTKEIVGAIDFLEHLRFLLNKFNINLKIALETLMTYV